MPEVLTIAGFADRLRDTREEAALTQRELAVEVGLKPFKGDGGSVAHWENGRAFPSLPRFTLLCEVLEVSADYLLYGEL